MRNVCLLIGVAEGDASNTDVEGDRETSSSIRTQPRKGRNLSSTTKFYGVELSPDNVAVAMVYFVQGVLGLARLAVSFYLKDDLHLDPAEVCPCNAVLRRLIEMLLYFFTGLSWISLYRLTKYTF